MESGDRSILEHELAGPIGRAVSQWCRKNGITDEVYVSAEVRRPTCYVDDDGVVHTGIVVTVDCTIADDDDTDDEF